MGGSVGTRSQGIKRYLGNFFLMRETNPGLGTSIIAWQEGRKDSNENAGEEFKKHPLSEKDSLILKEVRDERLKGASAWIVIKDPGGEK